MTKSLACFWSYSHQDDSADGGGIRALAHHLSEEYSLLTGGELRIFVDRDAIAWGDLWRERIDGSLSDTTFFIPIITPRYFTRVECRRELLQFVSQAKSLGVEELLMPILYAPVAEFSSDNADEAVAIVARSHYYDWTSLRLSGETSAEYRRGVNALGHRLVEASSRVSETHLARESTEKETRPADLIETLQIITESWPELLELVEEDRVSEKQWFAFWNALNDRVARLRRSGRSGARFVVIQKAAADLIRIADARIERARLYSARTIELDPLLISLIREAQDSVEIADFLAQLKGDVEDIEQRIIKGGNSTGDPMAYMDDYAKLSSGMRKAQDTFRTSQRYSEEGNRIVMAWNKQFQSVTHDQ